MLKVFSLACVAMVAAAGMHHTKMSKVRGTKTLAAAMMSTSKTLGCGMGATTCTCSDSFCHNSYLVGDCQGAYYTNLDECIAGAQDGDTCMVCACEFHDPPSTIDKDVIITAQPGACPAVIAASSYLSVSITSDADGAVVTGLIFINVGFSVDGSHVTISDNEFNVNADSSELIAVEGARTTVSGNTFNCYGFLCTAIDVWDTSVRTTISDNTFRGVTGVAIDVAGSKVSIRRNTFVNIDADPGVVSIQNPASQVKVKDNVFRDIQITNGSPNAGAVTVDTASMVEVSGNDISGVQYGDGISIYNSLRPVVKDNQISLVDDWAIQILTLSSDEFELAVVEGNTIDNSNMGIFIGVEGTKKRAIYTNQIGAVLVTLNTVRNVAGGAIVVTGDDADDQYFIGEATISNNTIQNSIGGLYVNRVATVSSIGNRLSDILESCIVYRSLVSLNSVENTMSGCKFCIEYDHVLGDGSDTFITHPHFTGESCSRTQFDGFFFYDEVSSVPSVEDELQAEISGCTFDDINGIGILLWANGQSLVHDNTFTNLHSPYVEISSLYPQLEECAVQTLQLDPLHVYGNTAFAVTDTTGNSMGLPAPLINCALAVIP